MAYLDPMRYMFVNPFNGRNDCSKYDSKELEIAYNIYRGELLESVPVQHVQISESEEYDSAHFQVNQNQLANLKRHSAYYNDYFTKQLLLMTVVMGFGFLLRKRIILS